MNAFNPQELLALANESQQRCLRDEATILDWGNTMDVPPHAREQTGRDARGRKEVELIRAGSQLPHIDLREGIFPENKMFRVLRDPSNELKSLGIARPVPETRIDLFEPLGRVQRRSPASCHGSRDLGGNERNVL